MNYKVSAQSSIFNKYCSTTEANRGQILSLNYFGISARSWWGPKCNLDGNICVPKCLRVISIFVHLQVAFNSSTLLFQHIIYCCRDFAVHIVASAKVQSIWSPHLCICLPSLRWRCCQVSNGLRLDYMWCWYTYKYIQVIHSFRALLAMEFWMHILTDYWLIVFVQCLLYARIETKTISNPLIKYIGRIVSNIVGNFP